MSHSSTFHIIIHHLEGHLDREDDVKNVIQDIQDLPLEWPRWNIRPLHGKRDAVAGDEDQNDKVETGHAGKLTAPDTESKHNLRFIQV